MYLVDRPVVERTWQGKGKSVSRLPATNSPHRRFPRLIRHHRPQKQPPPSCPEVDFKRVKRVFRITGPTSHHPKLKRWVKVPHKSSFSLRHRYAPASDDPEDHHQLAHGQ